MMHGESLWSRLAGLPLVIEACEHDRLHEPGPRCRSRASGRWRASATHLATLELWLEPPEWDVALRFRSWAFESAALDLALRQARAPAISTP